MKNFGLMSFLLFALFALGSCTVIEGIFKAGVWVGVLSVVAVIGLIIFLIVKMTGKK